MIICPTVNKKEIQTHYNLATLFYRLLWGVHMHHGLWYADETPEVAQLQMVRHLAEEAGIGSGQSVRVLDVGGGMGGSSIYLAEHFGCEVTGITISRVQRHWASCAAWWRGLQSQLMFACQDVETVEYPTRSF